MNTPGMILKRNTIRKRVKRWETYEDKTIDGWDAKINGNLIYHEGVDE